MSEPTKKYIKKNHNIFSPLCAVSAADALLKFYMFAKGQNLFSEGGVNNCLGVWPLAMEKVPVRFQFSSTHFLKSGVARGPEDEHPRLSKTELFK